MRINPFPNDRILDSSKLKEFAGDNFQLDENGRKLSKQVENTYATFEHCLTHYQTANFRLAQIETNCRRHFEVHLK